MMLRNWLLRYGAAPVPCVLLVEGDSISANPGASSTTPRSVLYVATRAATTPHYRAVSGSLIGGLETRQAVDNTYLSGTAQNIETFMIGANDLNVGAMSAATFLADVQAYADDQRTAGWTVVCETMLPRDDPGADAGFEAKRQTVNAALRTWVGVHCDALCDYDRTTMGPVAAASDPALYPDGLHPSNAGQIAMLVEYGAVLDGIAIGKVLPPYTDLLPGTYNDDQTVTLSDATSGAAIYYSINGGAWTLYSAPFTMSVSGDLSVKATKAGMVDSDTYTTTVEMVCSTPVLSPTPGEYVGTQDVSPSGTTGATYYYTTATDGSEPANPTTSSTLYTGPVSVAVSTIIKFLAVKTGYTDSAITTAVYAIDTGSYITATGGTITTDGDYKVHEFTSSGDFEITAGSGYVRALVLAGGAGGGSFAGGGGGAGEPWEDFMLGLVVDTYPVVVGAGGAGGTAGSGKGANGSVSSFNGRSTVGGGGGGGNSSNPAQNGGSGGGGGYQSLPGGLATGAIGNDGGMGNAVQAGGGGGGSGAVGVDATGANGGNGGAGTSSSIAGSAVSRAAGGAGAGSGAGGTGGTGGGGNGGKVTTEGATAGTANTGSGGGGNYLAIGAAGGSGVVIVRYKFQ